MKKNLLYLLPLIIIGSIAYWFYSNETGNSIDSNPLTNFAIEDTSSVHKIVIVDRKDNSVSLERGSDEFWMINDKYRVRKHTIKLLLSTFVGIGVQSTVPEKQKEAIMRHMLNTHTKVEIYGDDNKWIKTWHIGGATNTNQGTYMILETPEGGVSSEPYIMEKRGFRGYLTSRFHTNVNEWRWKGVFYYPNMNIKNISVERPKMPERNYQVRVDDLKNNDIKLIAQDGSIIPADPKYLQLYLMKYQLKYLEEFDNPILTKSQEDSIASRVPDYIVSVTDDKDNTTTIKLQFKGHPGFPLSDHPKPSDIDEERMFASFRDEFVQIQRFNFDGILVDIDKFPRVN